MSRLSHMATIGNATTARLRKPHMALLIRKRSAFIALRTASDGVSQSPVVTRFWAGMSTCP